MKHLLKYAVFFCVLAAISYNWIEMRKMKNEYKLYQESMISQINLSNKEFHQLKDVIKNITENMTILSERINIPPSIEQKPKNLPDSGAENVEQSNQEKSASFMEKVKNLFEKSFKIKKRID
jgi:hypothetical protein